MEQKYTNRNTCLVTLWKHWCLGPLSTDWCVPASACTQLLISGQQPPKPHPVSRQYLLRALPTWGVGSNVKSLGIRAQIFNHSPT